MAQSRGWWTSLIPGRMEKTWSRSRRPRLRAFQPRLERLEERLVPATSAFFSMPTNLAGNQGTVVTVPLSISHLSDASGNQGLNSADAILTYDPTVFTVSNVDVTQGGLLTNAPPSGTWTFTPNTATPGEVDISMASSSLAADVTGTTGGVLANINFHIKGAAPTGNSTIHVVVPPEMSPNGLTGDAMPHSGPNSIQGDATGYTLNPADQVDGVINVQNFAPVTTLSIPTKQPGTVGGNTVVVPINISNPDPNGSAGMISADAAILFDPNLLSVAATGAVAAGSDVPATGWTVTYGVDTSGNNLVDPTKASLGLHLANTNNTPLTSTSAGSLWLVTFTINTTTAQTTPLNLVPSAKVGASITTTNVTGANKSYQLNPAPTNASNDAVDGSIQINGAATHFAVSTPASATAGNAFSFTITALDAGNNTAFGYSGTVHFTSSDGNAVLPADTTLSFGTGTFSATLKTAGNQVITATDTNSSSITGTSNNIAVSAAAATHFAVTAPSSATAGSAFSFTVTAQDQFNNTATSYGGTVHFTSSDGQAVLPANSALTNGTGTFSATLKTAGNQTITATDTSAPTITGTSNSISVAAAAATHFTVTAPATATAGTAFNLTITAQDQFNNIATGYAGTVHFTNSDGQAVLPANSPLTNGTGSFSATMKTPGNQTITATDTTTASITGTSNIINVIAGTATHFTVSAPTTVTSGTQFSFTVTALDAQNNVATGYTGTVHFTSTDGQAVLPADTALTNGTRTLSATLKTAGSQTITATDTTTSTITGTSNSITVNAPPTITSASNTTFVVRQAGSFTITTSGTPSVTKISESGAVPAGVTFTDNGNGSATLSGTPATNTGKSYTLTFTATNGVSPDATQTFTLLVDQSPTISSVQAATFVTGTLGSFTVATTGFPAPVLSEGGALPQGVTFDTSTGIVSGTPAAGTGGTYVLTFTATNGVSPDASQTVVLTVLNTVRFATGAGAGGGPQVIVYQATTGQLVSSFFAYDPGFTGGVTVAVADVNGDGTPDVITGAGAGGGPHVKVIDGNKLNQLNPDGEISSSAVLTSFFAFDPAFTGGVAVGAGRFDTNPGLTVITGAGQGGGPNVALFNVQGGAAIPATGPLGSFMAFAAGFTGGVTVAAGDLNGTGIESLIVGAGPGGGPQVSVFNPANGAVVASFFAYPQAFSGGVFVAAGKLAGGSRDQIFTGAGAGGGPQVNVFNGQTFALINTFLAFPVSFTGGVRVAGSDLAGSGNATLVTGAGPGAGPQVQVFDPASQAAVDSFFAYAAAFQGGVFVG